MNNGSVWKWVAGIVIVVGSTIITNILFTHETRITTVEVIIRNVDTKLDKLIRLLETKFESD
jgi:hypothetical protein